MKYMIMCVFILFFTTATGMGTAVQLAYEAKIHNQCAAEHQYNEDNAIWTGFGSATIDALQRLSCMCSSNKKGKPRHHLSFIGSKKSE